MLLQRISASTVRLLMAIVALGGLFDSAYLLYVYVNGGPIRCVVIDGCDVVRASSYAWVFGLPRPLLGVIFYFLVFDLLVVRATIRGSARSLWRLTQFFVLAGLLESIHLFLIQWQVLQAFCSWCLLSGLATVLLAVLAPFDQPTDSERASLELKNYFIFLLIFLPVAVLGFYRLVF